MVKKVSFKFLIAISVFFGAFFACVDPVNITAFFESPEVKIIVETTDANKKQPEPTETVIIDPDSEVTGLTAGDGTISGLTPGKYYMVEEYDEVGGTLQRTRFVKASGDHGTGMDEIGLLGGTQIKNLKNSYAYRVRAAKPFDEGTYDYFKWGDSSTTPATATTNGGVTVIPVIGSDSYNLNLNKVIKADKLYEVMMVSGSWTASRTNAQYSNGEGNNLVQLGTSYNNNKYYPNSNRLTGVYQYTKDVYTGGAPPDPIGINLNTKSIIVDLPVLGESKDYVFAEWSDVYQTENNSVTNFTFVRVVVSAVPLPPLTGTVTIDGTAEVGQTLTANILALDGTGALTYQWKRGGADITGATSSTYTLVSADAGSTITVTVTRTGYSGSVNSAPTSTVLFPLLTGTVTIDGTAEVGQQLTANTTALGGTGVISYQWVRGASENITGATSANYTVQYPDVGYQIKVTVTRAETTGSITSTPTTVVPSPTLPPLTGSVTITGDVRVGSTLGVDISGLTYSGTLSYQWTRGITNLGTGLTYTLVLADYGSTIKVTVTSNNNSGNASDETGTVDYTLLTGTVTITNGTTALVGQTLEADTSALDGTGALTYQWKRGGTNVGTNSANYTLTSADIGYTITVEVTRANYSGSVTGGPTASVTDPGLPAITGTVTITNGTTAKVGQTLTANTTSVTYSGTLHYEWKRDGVSFGSDIATYTLVTTDVGSKFTVTVTASGNSGSLDSAATAIVSMPKTTVDMSGFTLKSWPDGPEPSANFGASNGSYNDTSKTLDLYLTATVDGANSYTWYYGSEAGTPLSTNQTFTGKYSLYSGVTGYVMDIRWFQTGTHHITLVTDVATYEFSFVYTPSP